MDSSPTNTLWIFAWPLASAPQDGATWFPETALQHNPHWQWGSLHGLQITEADLQTRLTRLQAPALLIELCMGASWRLQFILAGDPPVFFTHDWKTGPTKPDFHLLEEGLQTLGRQAPDGLRQLLEGPVDPLAVETPVGNLPQVLRMLDLSEVFPGWEEAYKQAQKDQQQQQADLYAPDAEGVLDSLQQLGRQLIQAIQKPRTGDVLLQGESGVFWQGVARDLTASQRQALDLATAELQALEFQQLGDCVWEPGGDVFLRVFKHAEHAAYAGILLHLFGCVTEFASYFASGAVLMTSPIDDAQHQPDKLVFKYSYPDALPADLWQAHVQHVSAFDEPLKPLAASLEAFLPQLDQLLALQTA